MVAKALEAARPSWETGDEHCINFVKEKVEACVKYHKCGRYGEILPLLLDRVIWVEANKESGIQLVEPGHSSKVHRSQLLLGPCELEYIPHKRGHFVREDLGSSSMRCRSYFET